MHVELVGLHDDGKYALSVRYAASTTAASTDAPAGALIAGPYGSDPPWMATTASYTANDV